MHLLPHPARTCVLALAVLLSLSACSSSTAEAPTVPDSMLVDVLVGLHLAEARAQLQGAQFQGEVPENMRDSILARYHLDADRFAAIMEYYVAHPDSYATLYRNVLNRLSNERATLTLPDSLL